MMLKWFKRKSNETKVNINVDMSQEEVSKIASVIEEQNSESEEVELTPELCRELQRRRKIDRKNELIKDIKRRIKLGAKDGFSRMNIKLYKKEERLYTNLDFIRKSSIHANDLDEILDVFRNKGFEVNVDIEASVGNVEQVNIGISWN